MPFNQDIKHYLTCRKAILVEQPTIECHRTLNPGVIPQFCLPLHGCFDKTRRSNHPS